MIGGFEGRIAADSGFKRLLNRARFIWIQAENRAQVHGCGSQQLEPVLFRAGHGFFVSVDLARSERFEPHAGEESFADMAAAFDLEFLMVDVEPACRVLLNDALGQPIAQEAGSATVAIAGFRIGIQRLVQFEADDVVGAAIVETLLESGINDVVGRADHVAEGADAGKIVAMGAKCLDVGHDCSPRFTRPVGSDILRKLSPRMNPARSTMDTAEIRSILTDRIAYVEERIGDACRRAKRSRAEITLVAVTKSTSIEVASLLPELGVKDLGESRPQELWRRAEAIRDVRWHLIGHLQRNKVERTLPLVQWIHSVDSERLLDAIQSEVRRNVQPVQVLLEVNLSREPNKHGFSKEEMPKLIQAVIRARGYAIISGMMTMAAHEEDPEKCRATFAELRQLRDQLRNDWSSYGAELSELSMGMTNDFEVAIEEGATMVRIGSALFEGLEVS